MIIINVCTSVQVWLCRVLKTFKFQSFGEFGIVDKGMEREGTHEVPGMTSEPSSAPEGLGGNPISGSWSLAKWFNQSVKNNSRTFSMD